MGGCVGDDTTDARQAIGTIGQGHLRLKGQTITQKVRISTGDVGWISNNQIKMLISKGSKPVAETKLDRRPQTSGIVARNRNCPWREVDRKHPGLRTFQRQ